MRQFVSTLSLVALVQLIPNPVYAQTTPDQLKPETNQSLDPVQKVVAANLMTKYPDGNFHPERFMSRAELASIMVKTFLLDKQETATKDNINVTDVSSSHPAFEDIQTVLKTGVMRGYRGNLFFPNQKITRAEALAIFGQAYGVFQFPETTVNGILSEFPDQKDIPSWARKAVATTVVGGFANQKTDGSLAPLKPMTRGDMAYVLSRYLQRQQRNPYTPEVTPIQDNSLAPR